MTIREDYNKRFDSSLQRLAVGIESLIRDYLRDLPRIDRIAARAKSVDRFVAKSEKVESGQSKYVDPLNQIQDQIGARIITFYLSDVATVSKVIEAYFRPVESKLLIPESEWEFGYFGKHYILLTPTDVIEADMDHANVPDFFELQIKTLFQHAWSEAEHDLGYKPGANPLTADEKRRMAFTAAQSWGADRLFDELFRERSNGAPAHQI
jgi:ppGpp synthetase/RelA/SpoT-type nucleotidyltranferase